MAKGLSRYPMAASQFARARPLGSMCRSYTWNAAWTAIADMMKRSTPAPRGRMTNGDNKTTPISRTSRIRRLSFGNLNARQKAMASRDNQYALFVAAR